MHSTNELKTYTIHATDGDLGRVKDLYFDDDQWTVRYYVIDTRKWLPGNKVLLSPISLDNLNDQERSLNVLASKETVKDSPSIDEEQTVSRQYEANLSNYYGWNYYWGGNGYWGGYGQPKSLFQLDTTSEDIGDNYIDDHENHLRSVNEVTGYKINAKDGKIGEVQDFLINEESWTIDYIVVDTNRWLPGKSVLLKTEWITDVNWHEREVTVNVSKEAIEKGPIYDPETPFTKEFEEHIDKVYEIAR